MAVFSKELCRQRLKIWLAAEEAIATGQRYQIEGRSLTRADLYDVRKELEYWAGKLAEAESEEKNGAVYYTNLRAHDNRAHLAFRVLV